MRLQRTELSQSLSRDIPLFDTETWIWCSNPLGVVQWWQLMMVGNDPRGARHRTLRGRKNPAY